MRKRKLQILVGIIAALGVAWLFYSTRENDPEYKGKRLSEWLEVIKDTGGASGVGFEPPELRVYFFRVPSDVKEAVAMEGTNAIPLLVRMLGAKSDSRLAFRIQDFADKHAFVRKLIGHRRDRVANERRRAALFAFTELGSQAAPAIPAIIRLLDDPECAESAVFALRYLRPKRPQDIVSLTNVFRLQKDAYGSEPTELHLYAMHALSTFGTSASGAAPALMGYLTSTNAGLRVAAAKTLVKIGARPAGAVPVLADSLPKSKQPNPPTPYWIESRRHGVVEAVSALGEFGDGAADALSALTNLAELPDWDLRAEAMVAAAKIRGDTNSMPR